MMLLEGGYGRLVVQLTRQKYATAPGTKGIQHAYLRDWQATNLFVFWVVISIPLHTHFSRFYNSSIWLAKIRLTDLLHHSFHSSRMATPRNNNITVIQLPNLKCPPTLYHLKSHLNSPTP